uniref:ATP synthase peripheral stalk subunit F6, mitochondrial n=1 Tax=Ailuropoda melanoleuca TaxID=9646 RepID=A0A7N5KHG4_AILME
QILQKLPCGIFGGPGVFRFSSIAGSAVSVRLWKTIGVTAVALLRNLILCRNSLWTRSKNINVSDRHLEDLFILGSSISKSWRGNFLNLKQTYGKADINTFSDFEFDDPKF